MLYIQDETLLWGDSDLVEACGGVILAVYVFDERRHVHCCELMPSFEMHFLRSIPGTVPDPPNEAEFLTDALYDAADYQYEMERDRIDQLLLQSDGDTPPSSHIHAYRFGKLVEDALDDHWDGETVPCCVDLWQPTAEEWEEMLDDADGDHEQAHESFIEGLIEAANQGAF